MPSKNTIMSAVIALVAVAIVSRIPQARNIVFGG